ncbi:MAG: hypothetical protein KU38_03615 [Sulfurovum sp. FS08-3]|nr:MAG: hypothetical protein KU38_03615 [Sulfurovum sp. FS08-3]
MSHYGIDYNLLPCIKESSFCSLAKGKALVRGIDIRLCLVSRRDILNKKKKEKIKHDNKS